MPKTRREPAPRKQSNNQPSITAARKKPTSRPKASKPAKPGKLEMHKVDSTVLEAIGYDDDRGALRVTYNDPHETYDYFLVPRQVYEELLKAGSKGQFFHKWVRGKSYPSEKVE